MEIIRKMYSCDTLLANTTIECGFSGISKVLCEARGCCFNAKLKYPHLHCFPSVQVKDDDGEITLYLSIIFGICIFVCCCMYCVFPPRKCEEDR